MITFQELIYKKKHVFLKKRKHINTHFHFICEIVNNRYIVLEYFVSKDQLSYIFTDPLGKNIFDFQKEKLGVTSVSTCNS